jgi:DNA-directed RNA polymerase subunit RPC12/RpoP
MIYAKAKLKDGTVVCSPVTAKNTITHCAKCGKETPIDLRELIFTGAEDPFDTEVTCADCTNKMLHKGHADLDAVVRLVTALKDLGYRMEVFCVCEDFEIGGVGELAPEEYGLFAEALLDKIAEVRHDG